VVEIEIENSRSTTEAARRTCIQKVEEYMEILKEGPGIYQTGDLVYHNGVYGNFERGRDREYIKPAISSTIVVYMENLKEEGP
jgi:hypothetical protein